MDPQTFTNYETWLILEKFHFDKINLKTAEGKKTFVEDLRAFEEDLIKAGIDKEEIQKIIDIILGKHPSGGFVKNPTSGQWRGGGWKIHLHVKPRNQIYVYGWLNSNCPFGWKYLGGTKGKEFTIYVGSWDTTETMVGNLETGIIDKIEQPMGECLLTDMHIGQRCMARFDLYSFQRSDLQKEFTNYGFYGIPVYNKDLYETYDGDQRIEEIRKRDYRRYIELIKTFVLKAYEKLEEIFGVYFTGARKQVRIRVWEFINYGHIIEDKNRLRVSIKKSY